MPSINARTSMAAMFAMAVIAVASCSQAADEPKKDAATSEQPSAQPATADKPAGTSPDAPAPPAAAPAAASGEKTAVVNKPPLEVAKANKLGTMHNPYTDDAAKIEEGKKLYFSYSCNGCHGGGGGGGMCPPLTNETWVYGSNDDILFRLISQGSQEMTKEHGLKRKGQESVVGPMPPFGELIKSDDELWKIIAFVHTLYKGSKRDW